jgi:hypothetical protein
VHARDDAQCVVNERVSEYAPGGGRGAKKLLVCTQTMPNDVVLRLHRREGDDRRLADGELAQWRDALIAVADAATADTTIWMLVRSAQECVSQRSERTRAVEHKLRQSLVRQRATTERAD